WRRWPRLGWLPRSDRTCACWVSSRKNRCRRCTMPRICWPFPRSKKGGGWPSWRRWPQTCPSWPPIYPSSASISGTRTMPCWLTRWTRRRSPRAWCGSPRTRLRDGDSPPPGATRLASSAGKPRHRRTLGVTAGGCPGSPAREATAIMTQSDSRRFGPNFVPPRYRQVSVQPYAGEMTAAAIARHLLGRDAYRRTRFVILRQGATCAIAFVERAGDAPLFSPITAVDILALPNTCVWADDDSVDTGTPSALASKAVVLGVDPNGTLVVRGLDQLTNF